jgi:hypothetical protein
MVHPAGPTPTTKVPFVAEAPGTYRIESELDPNDLKKALSILAHALTDLDMAGRQQIAPLFESFARAPGQVIMDDIAALLKETKEHKSRAAEKVA